MDPASEEPPQPQLWTVGHSNVPIDRFLALLASAGIGVVADVRSVPASRFVPWFDRDPLRDALAGAGVGYVYLGDALGGRPVDPALYDEDGGLRHDLVSSSAAFRSGLDRLLVGVRDHRVAIVCAEEDPRHCHRRLLVGRAAEDAGAEVRHLRGDGSVVTEADLSQAERREQHPSLFDG